jgi:hypothetical protein
MSPEIISIKEAQLMELAGEMKPGHLGIAIHLAEGKTQEDSYVSAGYLSREPRKRASEIIQTNPDIRWYVAIAKEVAVLRSQESLIGSLDQKRAMLWNIAQVCSKYAVISDEELVKEGEKGNALATVLLADPKTAISAIAELNKMDGDHAAIRGEITGANGAPIQTESTSWVIEGVAPGVTIEGETEPELLEQS